MSPPSAIGVALGTPAGAADVDGLDGCGSTGIWPHALSSAEIPTMARAVALRVATTVVLWHALAGFARSDKP
jgi:hypothetical protein